MAGTPENYKVVVYLEDDAHRSFTTTEGDFIAAVVDADIAAFGEYFQRELKNDEPLSKSEKAILKTYLWWKTHPEKHDAEQDSSSERV